MQKNFNKDQDKLIRRSLFIAHFLIDVLFFYNNSYISAIMQEKLLQLK